MAKKLHPVDRKRSNVVRKLIRSRTQRFNFEKDDFFHQSQSNVTSVNKFPKTTNFFFVR